MPAAWLVRGGSDGEFEDSALREGLVIAGWECGDLTSAAGKQDVRRELVRAYPDEGKATIGNWTGQLWRLVGEIKDQDFVVMPLKTRQIAIGQVVGPYRFRSDAPSGFQHVRPVHWVRTDLLRTAVRQDLLNSMGSLLTVCQLQRFGAARRIAHLAGHGVDPGAGPDELPQRHNYSARNGR